MFPLGVGAVERECDDGVVRKFATPAFTHPGATLSFHVELREGATVHATTTSQTLKVFDSGLGEKFAAELLDAVAAIRGETLLLGLHAYGGVEPHPLMVPWTEIDGLLASVEPKSAAWEILALSQLERRTLIARSKILGRASMISESAAAAAGEAGSDELDACAIELAALTRVSPLQPARVARLVERMASAKALLAE